MPNDHALASLGWDDGWARAFASLSLDAAVPARVLAAHRSGHLVAAADGERHAVAAGRLRHGAADPGALPTVGDWVAVDDAVIRVVLPRRSAFVRRAPGPAARPQVVAANVDVAAVVAPLADAPNARWLERFVAVAWESGATPLVVLTKSDLCDGAGSVVASAIAAASLAAPGVDVVALSAVSGEGLDALERHLAPARTVALVGKSGAGKSTLVNRLLGRERMATHQVRGDGKGRHTTSHRELVPLPGGALLVDTPGMRELALWDADAGIAATYADVESLGAACRFADCAHAGEPGCAVAAAVDAGALDAARLHAWHKLRRELAAAARRADPRRAAAHNASVRAIHREQKRMQRRRER